jgi:hypothetical protein
MKVIESLISRNQDTIGFEWVSFAMLCNYHYLLKRYKKETPLPTQWFEKVHEQSDHPKPSKKRGRPRKVQKLKPIDQLKRLSSFGDLPKPIRNPKRSWGWKGCMVIKYRFIKPVTNVL